MLFIVLTLTWNQYQMISYVTAGCIAHQMGLPLRLVCCVNANNIVERAINRGDFSAADTVLQTLAPAMDIQVGYFTQPNIYYITWA